MQRLRRRLEKWTGRGDFWMIVIMTAFFAVAIAAMWPVQAAPDVPEETAAPSSFEEAAPEPEPEPQKNLPQEILNFVARHPEAAAFAAGYPGTVQTADIDLSQDCAPGEIPLLLQFDARWGYAYYGGKTVSDLMGLSGCGPTALSMAAVGLTGNTDWNPLAVAEYAAKHDYWTESDGTKWLLISEGCRDMGLTAQEVPLDQSAMEAALLEGGCIICVVGPGDFTDKGHFLVLCGFDSAGFSIRDPASRANSEKTWTYEQLSGQINAMWAMTAE